MDVIEAILTRRSIRKYKSAEVEESKVHMLLEAAFMAPSAGNQQPWHFILVKNRKLLNEIADRHPYAKMLYEAPLAIERYQGRWVLDCSASIENILLAARGLDLGTVWIGIHPDNERIGILRDILHIPADIHPHSLIAVGYPDEEKGKVDRFKPERIHKDLW
jgi:nitroreductase